MSQTPLSYNNLPVDIVASLKRQIDVLQAQNEELRKEPCKEKSNRYHLEGRAIQQLVCLTGYIGQLVAEHDQCMVLGAVSKSDADKFDSEDPKSFKKLLVSCPSVGKLTKSLVEDHDLAFAYSQLIKGADSARADDTTKLKVLVISWLSECTPPPDPILYPYDKTGHGFYNDATGRLLCPVDHNWNNSEVMAYSWPTFLYDGHYNARNHRDGLFKGKLLLKSLMTQSRLVLMRFLHMDIQSAKEPRQVAIAYATVQLCFALSSASSWWIMDDDFNSEVFYNHIVDFFELPPTQDAANEVDDILLWWNHKVFGRKYVSVYHPQRVEQLSVAWTWA
ncbi:uncharacterized protein BJ212DRAFT_1303104 [Suillus subaureus]|uniref:Uncharacterized protein n=1 Tax=Suillus subaureus TaxID=48587 RepID=A0A9P7E112_9AGAM|nr:uncharacterized protein BJ212DRAFT_1303104 [Suillus subaureus]KAG1808225.1 hypothetical protein BJ212DRAFT_1303104 [Suillus subaureus]